MEMILTISSFTWFIMIDLRLAPARSILWVNAYIIWRLVSKLGRGSIKVLKPESILQNSWGGEAWKSVTIWDTNRSATESTKCSIWAGIRTKILEPDLNSDTSRFFLACMHRHGLHWAPVTRDPCDFDLSGGQILTNMRFQGLLSKTKLLRC